MGEIIWNLLWLQSQTINKQICKQEVDLSAPSRQPFTSTLLLLFSAVEGASSPVSPAYPFYSFCSYRLPMSQKLTEVIQSFCNYYLLIQSKLFPNTKLRTFQMHIRAVFDLLCSKDAAILVCIPIPFSCVSFFLNRSPNN